MPKIMAMGDILVEFLAVKIGQRFDETLSFSGPHESGCCAIYVDQIARLGVDCGIFAKVGNDDFAEMMMRRLEGSGVNTSAVTRSETKKTGLAFVTYREDGSRSFIFHHANSAMGELGPDDIDESMFDDCEYFIITGANACATPSMKEATMKCVEIVKKRGIKMAFDPNFRPEKHTTGLSKIWEPILKHTSMFFGGLAELLAFSDTETLEDALKAPCFCDMDIIALKDGAKGCHILTEGKDIFVPPYKVEEVDPTGAGDTWNGAFLAMLAKGASIEEAGDWANAAGALAVTRKGPLVCATKEEIEALRATRR